MIEVLYIGIICFVTSVVGFICSFILSIIGGKTTLRQTGFFLGVTGGMLIAIICFELLPEAIIYSGTFLSAFTMLIALILCAYLEHDVVKLKNVINKRFLDLTKQKAVTAIIIGFNNVPEGFALGSVLIHTGMEEKHIIYALFLHTLIDGFLIFSNYKYNKSENLKSLKLILVTSFFMAISAIIGAFFTYELHIVMPLSIGFVSGMMLYVAFGEVIPKSRLVWNGRFSTLGACIGVVLVILINSMR